jgi:ABC-2 type transport system permease protein
MDRESTIVANLPAVTLQWASPLQIDEAANADRDVTVLLRSTADSWLKTDTNVNPDMQMYPKLGFPIEGEPSSRPLAASVRGSFDSFFKDRPSPFESGEAETTTAGGSGGTIGVSPDSSRLVVIGSAEFLDDVVLDISRSLSQDRYLLNLQLVQNAIDWAVEDEDLLSIRSRGTYTRLLRPLERQQQQFWVWFNCGVALLGLIGIGVLWRAVRRSEEPMIPTDVDAEQGGIA